MPERVGQVGGELPPHLPVHPPPRRAGQLGVDGPLSDRHPARAEQGEQRERVLAITGQLVLQRDDVRQRRQRVRPDDASPARQQVGDRARATERRARPLVPLAHRAIADRGSDVLDPVHRWSNAVARRRLHRREHRLLHPVPFRGRVPRSHQVERVHHVPAEGRDAGRADLRPGLVERGRHPVEQPGRVRRA